MVVDDSIVRGNTTKAIVAMLREAGAREVHVRITSPPVRWPCFYGIDMPTRAELVASDLRTDEVASYIGADSLGYLSLDALTETAEGPAASGARGPLPGPLHGLPDRPLPHSGPAFARRAVARVWCCRCARSRRASERQSSPPVAAYGP